ncbi:MAG: LacI family DNA-binding transcriptional regulator [Angustibacter sp.]
MTTMHDVAKAAGVSQSTVSHVLNGTRAIAPSTEAAVRKAIEETGYVHDDIARSLRSRRTNTIGVATSAISNIYFAEVVSAVERAATALNRIVMLVDTHDEPQREYDAVRTFVSRRVDGIVLAPSAEPERTLDLLHRRNVPTVLLDRFLEVENACDMVGVSNVEPTAQLVDLLAEAGHTDIAFVAGLRGLATSEERLEGFRQGMARNGLAAGPVLEGGSSGAQARAATVELLGRRDRPTALVSGNNAMTLGVLQAIGDAGLTVPDDVSLVCFDDLPWADLLSPRLTVAAQPLAEIGQRAMQMLHERIEDPGLPQRVVRLDPTIHRRESVAPPAARR